jgi:hypothetical protein
VIQKLVGVLIMLSVYCSRIEDILTLIVHQATEIVLRHTTIHFAPERAAVENRMLIFVVWGIAECNNKNVSTTSVACMKVNVDCDMGHRRTIAAAQLTSTIDVISFRISSLSLSGRKQADGKRRGRSQRIDEDRGVMARRWDVS